MAGSLLRAPVGLGESDSGRRWSLWKWLAFQGGSRVVPGWFQGGSVVPGWLVPGWFQVVPERSQVVPGWPGGSRVVPGWFQWFQSGGCPKWFQSGPKWFPSGSRVVPSGSRVVPGWRVSRGFQVVPGDSSVVPGWFQAGSSPGKRFT